jgi:hypothetical protein
MTHDVLTKKRSEHKLDKMEHTYDAHTSKPLSSTSLLDNSFKILMERKFKNEIDLIFKVEILRVDIDIIKSLGMKLNLSNVHER